MSNSYIVLFISRVLYYLRLIFEDSFVYRLTEKKQKPIKSNIVRTLMDNELIEKSSSFKLVDKIFNPKHLFYANESILLKIISKPFSTFISGFTGGIVALIYASMLFYKNYIVFSIITLFIGSFFIYFLHKYLKKQVYKTSLIYSLFSYFLNLDRNFNDDIKFIDNLSFNFLYFLFSFILTLITSILLDFRLSIVILVGLSSIGIIYKYRLFAVLSFLTIYAFLPDIMILLFSFLIFGLSIIDYFSGHNKTIKTNAILYSAFLITILYIVQTLTGLFPIYSLRELSMNLAGFFMMIFLISEINTKNKLHVLLNCLILGSCLISLYGLYQYVFKGTVAREWIDASLKGVINKRAYSVFNNPNIFSEYLVLTTPLSVLMLWYHRDFFKKFVYCGIFLLNSLNLLLTFSRGGYLSLAVSACVFLFFVLRPLLVLMIPASLFGMSFLPATILNRILSIFNFKDSSTSYRMKLWKITREVIQDHPLAGVGLGHKSFKTIFETYIRSMPIFHAHNTYLEMLAETGVVGFLTFIYCIIITFVNILKSAIKSEDKFIFLTGAAIIASGAGILIQGIFEHVIYINKIIILLWVFYAISAILKNICKQIRA